MEMGHYSEGHIRRENDELGMTTIDYSIATRINK